jgi:hypothetical protein
MQTWCVLVIGSLAWLLVLAQTATGQSSSSRPVPDISNWLTYRNTAAGLSFKYPKSLRLRERDPREFQLPPDVTDPLGLRFAPQAVIELIGDTPINRGTIVLQFEISRDPVTKKMAEKKIKYAFKMQPQEYDPQFASALKTIRLDGHQGLLRIDCDRAGTCHWTISMLQPHPCSIRPGLSGADAEESVPPPHDGRFPLLSILRTVHLEPPS